MESGDVGVDDGYQKISDQGRRGVATHNQSQSGSFFFFLSSFVDVDFFCRQQIDMQPISQ